MKKTLPVIVVLTTLSLLGLMVLQASWLDNLLVLRRGQLNNKINEAGVSVAVDLYKGINTAPSLKLRSNLGFSRFSNGMPIILNAPTVEEKYNLEDVKEKLNKAFSKEDLHYLKFEFSFVLLLFSLLPMLVLLLLPTFIIYLLEIKIWGFTYLDICQAFV